MRTSTCTVGVSQATSGTSAVAIVQVARMRTSTCTIGVSQATSGTSAVAVVQVAAHLANALYTVDATRTRITAILMSARCEASTRILLYRCAETYRPSATAEAQSVHATMKNSHDTVQCTETRLLAFIGKSSPEVDVWRQTPRSALPSSFG